MQSIPAPDALPSDAARKLAGDGLIDFRCDTGLHVLIGSSDDRMVIDKAGQAPLVLDKQAPGGTYDYMGGGWGAERRGDTVKLDRQGGPSVFCGVISSEEHTSELQSLLRISYAVFCLKKQKK